MAKNQFPMTDEQKIKAAKFFGKHVTREKALLLFIVTTLVCLLPCLIGIRLWQLIPPIVETGITDLNGTDDSMPRAVLVYGLPGLAFVLNLICHGQLWLCQKKNEIPTTPIRLLGRWVIPLIAMFLNTWTETSAAGISVAGSVWMGVIISACLLLLGSAFFDCKKGSFVCLPFAFVKFSDYSWKFCHRVVGGSWVAAGLIVFSALCGTGTGSAFMAIAAVAFIVIPVLIIWVKSKNNPTFH